MDLKNDRKILSIGLIGNGQWAQVIKKEIDNNKNFELKCIIYRNKIIPFKDCKIKKFTNYTILFTKEHFDCLYVAATPEVNYEVLKALKDFKIPIIFEKPIFTKLNDLQFILKYLLNKKHCILTNLPNVHSQIFIYLNEYINRNFNKIKKIYMIEGGTNVNPNIHPIFDWGIHPMTLILKLFGYDNIKKTNYKIIKADIKSYIAKIEFIFNNFNLRILTGNGFSKKIRVLRIELENNDLVTCDFIKHEFIINNKIIFKNNETPLTSLLNRFYLNINNKKNEKEDLKNSIRFLKIIYKHIS